MDVSLYNYWMIFRWKKKSSANQIHCTVAVIEISWPDRWATTFVHFPFPVSLQFIVTVQDVICARRIYTALMKRLVFQLARPHMYAHIRAYRPIPPSPLSSLAPVPIDTDGDGRMRYKERQTQREWQQQQLIPWVCIRSFPSPIPLSIHFFPYITRTCSIRPSTCQPSHPSLI